MTIPKNKCCDRMWLVPCKVLEHIKFGCEVCASCQTHSHSPVSHKSEGEEVE